MRIDAHQHFWAYSPEDYAWIGAGMERLARDYLPEHLAPLLRASDLDGTIAVQARHAEEETAWLLALADEHPFLRGVVGWTDLLAPDVEQRVAELAKHGALVGIRHVAQDEPDDGFLARADFCRGVATLARHGLVYDVLVYPRQLEAALTLVESLPEQRFVVDHFAKPLVKAGAVQPWAAHMRRLAEHPHVSCKLSGLITEADWAGWRDEDFFPYFDVVAEAFGEERVLFGTDWPVCLLAGEHARVVELARALLARAGWEDSAAIWGGNAARVYLGRA